MWTERNTLVTELSSLNHNQVRLNVNPQKEYYRTKRIFGVLLWSARWSTLPAIQISGARANAHSDVVALSGELRAAGRGRGSERTLRVCLVGCGHGFGLRD